MSDPRKPCTEHARTLAAWRCLECRRALCEECGAAGRVKLIHCAYCDGVSVPMTWYADPEPFWRALPRFMRYMLTTRDGLIQLVALAFALLVLRIGLFIGMLVGIFLFTSYYLLIVRAAADGETELPPPSLEVLGGIGGALLRLLVASAWLWAPVALYLNYREGLVDLLMGSGRPLGDAVGILIALLVAALMPACVVIAAIGDSLIPMVDPRTALRLVRSVPRDYAQAAGFWVAMWGADRLLAWVLELTLGQLPIPVLPTFVIITAGLVPAFMSAYALGRIAYQNGPRLGLYPVEELEKLQVPDAKPRAPRHKRRDERDDILPMDMGLVAATASLGPAPTAPPPSFEGIPLADELPADEAIRLVPDERQLHSRGTLGELLEAGDNRAALTAYRQFRQYGVGDLDLTASQELALAGALEEAADLAGAAQALQRAAERDLTGPHAPQAIFSLAILLIERLGNNAAGEALLHQITENYADHVLAAEARTRLAPRA